MVRSFQISAVFPHLTVLENVRVAPAEEARHLLRLLAIEARAQRIQRARDGAHQRCRLVVVRRIRPRWSCPTAANARSRSQPRWRSTPKCSCSTSQWRGMGHEDIDRVSALIKSVAADRTVLMVEHNLSVVGRSVRPHHGAHPRRVLAEGDYETVSANPQVREAYHREPAMLSPGRLLPLAGSRRAAGLVRRIARAARRRPSRCSPAKW